MPSILTCAKLALDAYSKPRPSTVLGYVPVMFSPGGPAGFYGAAYIGQVGVIAFRGSQEKEDWTDADVDIARNRLPSSQIGDALQFYNRARDALNN